jgi:hypothetical protein
MRKIIGGTFILTCFATLAAAQIPTRGNIFAGYSYYNTNLGADRQSLNGWEGSVEGSFFPFVGIVADFSANYGDLKFTLPCPPAVACPVASVNSHIDNFLIGPRVSVSLKGVRPFAEAFVGFGHVNTNGFGSDTSFASGVGGGLDFKLFGPIAWRFEGDYLHTHLFDAPQNNVRLTTGVVLRF